jgi:hypothetical protein
MERRRGQRGGRSGGGGGGRKQLLVLLTAQRQAIALEPSVVKHASRVVLLLLLTKFAHTGVPDQCETLRGVLVLK